MKSDTEKWGAFCPCLVPKHQVKHIIGDRAALSKLMFRSFWSNNFFLKSKEFLFEAWLGRKNCGNQYGDGSQLNRFHRIWLTPWSHSFHILELGEEIWSPSAILLLKILRCLRKKPLSQGSPVWWPRESQGKLLWGAEKFKPPTLASRLPDWSSSSWAVSLPSPLPTAVSSPQNSQVIFLKCKSNRISSLFKSLPMAFHHTWVKIQNPDHGLQDSVICLCPFLVHNHSLPPSLHARQLVSVAILLTYEAHFHLRTFAVAISFFLKYSFPRSSYGSFLQLSTRMSCSQKSFLSTLTENASSIHYPLCSLCTLPLL